MLPKLLLVLSSPTLTLRERWGMDHLKRAFSRTFLIRKKYQQKDKCRPTILSTSMLEIPFLNVHSLHLSDLPCLKKFMSYQTNFREAIIYQMRLLQLWSQKTAFIWDYQYSRKITIWFLTPTIILTRLQSTKLNSMFRNEID